MEVISQFAQDWALPMFQFFTSKNMLYYVLFNVATFLIVKYYGLRDQMRGKNTKEVKKNYFAFWREDLDNLNVFWCMPFYCLFWPRFIIMIVTVGLAGVMSDLLINDQGAEEAAKVTQKKKRNIKHSIVKRLIQNACFHCFAMGGYMKYTTEKVDLDYSEYLGVKGKDWKVEYEGASTLVSNHCSWFDVAFAIFYYFPVLTSRATIADVPFIGSVFKAMNTIFIARVGSDAKASKALAAQKIMDHQIGVDAGKLNAPCLIYPEGATKKQTELIQFRPGAFKALTSVQPYTLKYDNIWGIEPQSFNGRLHTTFYVSTCMPPLGVIRHKQYPVFRPNQYFWDTHWEPVKDKESKAETYMRVIRNIMLKEDKFVDSQLSQDDQFGYSQACQKPGRKLDLTKEA